MSYLMGGKATADPGATGAPGPYAAEGEMVFADQPTASRLDAIDRKLDLLLKAQGIAYEEGADEDTAH